MDPESKLLGVKEHGTRGQIHRFASQVCVQHFNQRKFFNISLFRNGLDWVRACELVSRPGVTSLFSSPQCLGYRGERGQLGEELCSPGTPAVMNQLGEAIR